VVEMWWNLTHPRHPFTTCRGRACSSLFHHPKIHQTFHPCHPKIRLPICHPRPPLCHPRERGDLIKGPLS